MNDKNNRYSLYNIYKVAEETELLSFIMKKMDGISRNKAKAILSGNAVTVNKRTERQYNYILKPGMVVKISKSKETHKQERQKKNPFYKIIFEDKWLIVIDKAPNILSMAISAKSINIKSLLNLYFEQSQQNCTAHVVHRLDRDTSGLMIYAKSVEVQQTLEYHWKELVTDRRYIAVVYGQMEKDEGAVESYITENKQFLSYSCRPEDGGKYALTNYKTIYRGEKFSLIELQLETGRKNQIRVHMHDINHPVVGDCKYGLSDDLIGRLGLHAYKLYFSHPITNNFMKFETRYPTRFQQLVKGSI